MAERRDNFLLNEHLAAHLAVLALGQAGFRAGRGLRRVDDFLVAERRDNFLLNEHLAARLAVLALGQAGFRTGRGLNRVDDFLVAERRDNFLLYEHLAACLTVLALGQAGFRAGRGLSRIDDFLVAERRDVIVHIAVAAGTGVRRIALIRAGRGRDDLGVGVRVRGLLPDQHRVATVETVRVRRKCLAEQRREGL